MVFSGIYLRSTKISKLHIQEYGRIEICYYAKF